MKLNDTTLFSVIVPTIGKRRTMLERCLKSIGNQSQYTGEVLVIVDNEQPYFEDVKKETKHIIDLFPEWHFDVRHTGRHHPCGASFARNYGTSVAKGKYLCFLDDDDAWKPNYLEKVFDGEEFDVALTAFEKHTPNDIQPEKVPPESLKAEYFYVANPGLRGSNLVVKKDIFIGVGGFDEKLPAFNDMDFGIRLSLLHGLKYKQIKDKLVEFHRHEGPRLSSPGCNENVEGMIAFLVKHSNSMGYLKEAQFRERAIKLWGVDPWSTQNMRYRIELVQENNSIVRDFGNILHALETRLAEPTDKGILNKDILQTMIDEICDMYEQADLRPPAPSLLIATTVTNSDTSLINLISSLKGELDISKWNYERIESEPIEILVVDNSDSIHVKEVNRKFVDTWSDNRIKIKLIDNEKEQQSIVGSRRYLCRIIKEQGLNISKRSPVWLMDDDLQFTALMFGKDGWTRSRHGSILHRLESIINLTEANAIVGGNTYCPPVMPLVTVIRQIKDIMGQFFSPNQDLPTWTQTMSFLSENPDAYYDLSREIIPERIVSLESRWWSDAAPMKYINDDILCEILDRIFSGLPVTRPLFIRNMPFPETAWWKGIDITVSGGNTIILDEDLLDERLYWVIDYKGSLSRRGDTCWAINASKKGFMIRGYNIPLYHQRGDRRSQDVSLKKYLTRGLELDVLGVGLYESLLNDGENRYSKPSHEILLEKIKKREDLMNTHLISLNNLMAEFTSLLLKDEYPRSVQIIEEIKLNLPDKIDIDAEGVALSIPDMDTDIDLQDKIEMDVEDISLSISGEGQ